MSLGTEMMDLGNANSVVTPGLKDEDLKMDVSYEDEKLDPVMTSMYRAVVARAQYLAQDRTDIIYAVSQLNEKEDEIASDGENRINKPASPSDHKKSMQEN